jgi:Uncharacterized conserved protein (DUF2358)
MESESSRADILSALKDDYARFPKGQTYSLYDPDVFFKDPLVSFRGVQLYRWMIGFMDRAFLDVQMDLHNIRRDGDQIDMDWTLSWVAPMPWKPAMQISGRSELALNADGLIQSQIDYWNCSRLDVLKQLFSR